MSTDGARLDLCRRLSDGFEAEEGEQARKGWRHRRAGANRDCESACQPTAGEEKKSVNESCARKTRTESGRGHRDGRIRAHEAARGREWDRDEAPGCYNIFGHQRDTKRVDQEQHVEGHRCAAALGEVTAATNRAGDRRLPAAQCWCRDSLAIERRSRIHEERGRAARAVDREDPERREVEARGRDDGAGVERKADPVDVENIVPTVCERRSGREGHFNRKPTSCRAGGRHFETTLEAASTNVY